MYPTRPGSSAEHCVSPMTLETQPDPGASDDIECYTLKTAKDMALTRLANDKLPFAITLLSQRRITDLHNLMVRVTKQLSSKPSHASLVETITLLSHQRLAILLTQRDDGYFISPTADTTYLPFLQQVHLCVGQFAWAKRILDSYRDSPNDFLPHVVEEFCEFERQVAFAMKDDYRLLSIRMNIPGILQTVKSAIQITNEGQTRLTS